MTEKEERPDIRLLKIFFHSALSRPSKLLRGHTNQSYHQKCASTEKYFFLFLFSLLNLHKRFIVGGAVKHSDQKYFKMNFAFRKTVK